MTLWWESYTSFQQAMFIIAATATLILFVFLILMMFGVHGDDFDGTFDGGFDHDFNDSQGDLFNDEPLSAFAGLKLFTMRGILTFFSVGGWVVFLCNQSLGIFLSIIIGVVSGLIAAFLLAYTFRQVMKLEMEGNLKYENAIGKLGEVYIRVPKNRSGKGKINMLLQERFVEMDAITTEEEDLKTGTRIIVTGVENESTVIIKRA
ncbi:MAG: hypothetical protein AB7U79_06145 [Candidatus Izemoplasmatales bacterium]